MILFDDQFKVVSTLVDPVETDGGYKNHTNFINNPINVSRNGYLYIFVSNKSNLEVFFDNLTVTHYKGPILEETHYYPFGLTMAGISSRAVGELENKFKFNEGSELADKNFSDGGGLDWYETPFRIYDPQIGRFLQIDPYSEEFDEWSPYNFAMNNPILLNDPTGLAADPPKDATTQTVLDPVVVKAKISPWRQYLNRMRVANRLGLKGPVVFEGDSKRTTREMQRIHGYETRKNAMDEAVGEAEILIVSTLLPVGELGQGIRWLYNFRKGHKCLKLRSRE